MKDWDIKLLFTMLAIFIIGVLWLGCIIFDSYNAFLSIK